MLLSTCGIIAAVVLWRALVAEIPEPADGSSVAARVSLTLAWLLPCLALLWVARAGFWAGYLVTPIGRGPGMAATVAATAMSLGGAVFVWWVPSL